MTEPHYIFDAPAELKRLSEMVFVEEGIFIMGSEDDDKDAFEHEKPAHDVMVDSFYIGKYSVTQAVWKTVMSDINPSYFIGDDLPVETVSWDDIQVFIEKLHAKTGKKYRLPTEAEWEYAAKGQQYFKVYPFKYAGGNKLNEVGWYEANRHSGTKSVGLKSPNFLGLHDMSGNVYEWCEDQWNDSYDCAPNDGRAWVGENEGTDRVLRGGNWLSSARGCRSTNRRSNAPSYNSNGISFRLVFEPPSI